MERWPGWAILSVYGKIAAARGLQTRCNPGLMATFYSAWDFAALREHLRRTARRDALVPNRVGRWVDAHLRFIGRAAGARNLCP